MPRRNSIQSYDYECDLDDPGAARTRQYAPSNTTKTARGGATKRSRVGRPAKVEPIDDSYEMDTSGYSMQEREYNDYGREEADEQARERSDYFGFQRDYDPFLRTPDFESFGAARTRQFQPNSDSKGPRIFLPKRPRIRRNQSNQRAMSPTPDYNDDPNFGEYQKSYDAPSDDDWDEAYGTARRPVAPAKGARRGARSEQPAKRGTGNQVRRRKKQQHQEQSSFFQYDSYDRSPPYSGMQGEMIEDVRNYMETFGCNYCTKVFSSKAARTKHEKRHANDMQFACVYCPMIFTDFGQKNSHELAHEEQQQFPCSYCSLHFQSMISRRLHELECAPEKSFTCSYCPISFITELQKEKHEKTHDEEQHSDRSYSPPMEDIAPPETPRQRKPRKKKEPEPAGPKPTFTCIFCPQVFASEFARARHLTTHPEMQTFPCDICQQRFSSVQSLTNHKQTHEKAKRIHCPYCPKDFGSLNRLKAHEKKVHYEEFPFVCQYCSKRFRRESQKAEHELCHDGQFSCSQCPQLFGTKEERDKHVSSHRKQQQERAFQCSYCARRFHLLEHKIAHESFHPKLTCISAETVDPRIL